MWELLKVRQGEEHRLLAKGWEPFAVSARNTSYEYTDPNTERRCTRYQSDDYIYLRREAKDDRC